MNRSAKVFYKEHFAGIIAESDNGFTFSYDPDYILNVEARPISLKLPIRSEFYESKILFPFFDGLIPEGWILNLAEKNWKINPRDRMGLLITFCKDTIGAVSVRPHEEQVI